jgi:hypothetical protein
MEEGVKAKKKGTQKARRVSLSFFAAEDVGFIKIAAGVPQLRRKADALGTINACVAVGMIGAVDEEIDGRGWGTPSGKALFF